MQYRSPNATLDWTAAGRQCLLSIQLNGALACFFNCRVHPITLLNARFNQLDSFSVLLADGNICFYGKCRNCFGERTGVCAEGKRIEGSIIMWLPEKLRRFRHPWWRTYGPGVTAR